MEAAGKLVAQRLERHTAWQPRQAHAARPGRLPAARCSAQQQQPNKATKGARQKGVEAAIAAEPAAAAAGAASPAGSGKAAQQARSKPLGEALDDFFDGETPDPPGHRAGFVTIIGKPNAGKSTLMNALLGQPLSIVTAKVQTTRHRILGILSEPAYQAVFLDTPGVFDKSRDLLDQKMLAAVQRAVKDADCLLAIVDVTHEAQEALAMIQPGDDWKGPPMAVLLNKTDLISAEQLSRLEEWYGAHCKADIVVPISAQEGTGLDRVREWIQSRLPESPALYPKDIVSELPERFFVAEIIRKHIMQQYRQEIPYGVAVEVVEYRERESGKDYIEAEVVLDKERLKGILIGHKGSALKQLSTASRVEIEEFLERPVYLQISLKVRDGWRKDPKQLERLGY